MKRLGDPYLSFGSGGDGGVVTMSRAHDTGTPSRINAAALRRCSAPMWLMVPSRRRDPSDPSWRGCESSPGPRLR